MNASKNLSKHYDSKFAGENAADTLVDYRCSHWPRNRHQAAVHWPGNGTRILDIGCGAGCDLYSLRDNFSELFGIDFSEERIKNASSAFREKGIDIELEVCDLEAGLSFPDEYFDYVICSAVIEHIIDVYKVLGEIRRVMRPGARAFINVPNIAKWTRRLKLLAGIYPATASKHEGLIRYDGHTPTTLLDEGHLHNFTYRSMRSVMERSGFKVIREVGFGPLGRVHDFWRELLSDDVAVIAEK